MGKLKAQIKELFYKFGFSALLDKLLFRIAFFKNKKRNFLYKNSNSNITFPPDYCLYETYQLNYQLYIEDGNLSAKEIIEWTTKYISTTQINILEWGCGVSRTTRHIHKYINQHSQIFACDINKEMIEWNEKYINNVSFSTISYKPPTNYFNSQFNLIYCISVFTHIDALVQDKWIKEIHRILNTNGIFLFTTHGSKYLNKLLPTEQKELFANGVYTKSYYKKGHRLMSTYNLSNKFKLIIEKYFDLLEFYDGEKHPEKLGGQDLWIVRKSNNCL